MAIVALTDNVLVGALKNEGLVNAFPSLQPFAKKLQGGTAGGCGGCSGRAPKGLATGDLSRVRELLIREGSARSAELKRRLGLQPNDSLVAWTRDDKKRLIKQEL